MLCYFDLEIQTLGLHTNGYLLTFLHWIVHKLAAVFLYSSMAPLMLSLKLREKDRKSPSGNKKLLWLKSLIYLWKQELNALRDVTPDQMASLLDCFIKYVAASRSCNCFKAYFSFYKEHLCWINYLFCLCWKFVLWEMVISSVWKKMPRLNNFNQSLSWGCRKLFSYKVQLYEYLHRNSLFHEYTRPIIS